MHVKTALLYMRNYNLLCRAFTLSRTTLSPDPRLALTHNHTYIVVLRNLAEITHIALDPAVPFTWVSIGRDGRIHCAVKVGACTCVYLTGRLLFPGLEKKKGGDWLFNACSFSFQSDRLCCLSAPMWNRSHPKV